MRPCDYGLSLRITLDIYMYTVLLYMYIRTPFLASTLSILIYIMRAVYTLLRFGFLRLMFYVKRQPFLFFLFIIRLFTLISRSLYFKVGSVGLGRDASRLY
ncbi:hypothetical protein NQ317_002131 [Molorchus minor]|uniref:Uncharacterized protein n=1 Tax=Molorchus minor TaxID=1323400 RepID=A0ABQ9JVP0_9CUCU|nr:hypothetical protein NQ317_002131 [Molorchus minor]